MKRRGFLSGLSGLMVVAATGVRIEINQKATKQLDNPKIIVGANGKRYRIAPLNREMCGGNCAILGNEEALDLIEVEEI